jgi:hypothetical protein
MKSVFILICSSLLIPGIGTAGQSVAPQSVAGDWEGNLGGNIPLVLHVRVTAAGELTATLDSPSQGANHLPGANVKLNGSTFGFEIPVVHGSYTGTLSADGKSLSGTWTQGQSSPLAFTQTKTGAEVAAAEAAVKPSPIDGVWKGALSAGGNTLHVVFHFQAAPDGILCSMDSVDQGANGIPCGDVTVTGKKVKLNVPPVNGTYSGSLRSDGRHIDGMWTQGTPLELDLTKQ